MNPRLRKIITEESDILCEARGKPKYPRDYIFKEVQPRKKIVIDVTIREEVEIKSTERCVIL